MRLAQSQASSSLEMNLGLYIRRLPAIALLLLVAACGAPASDSGEVVSPSTIPTITSTSTTTPTPTLTPTPTATAPPVVVSGDPLAAVIHDPVRQSGAPCGFADIFDFPLDPPDGERASGGGDYGRYRSRYDGNHTGEDWRVGASSLGQPVYSIGHGQVTYAQPNGWGADKGVIIVQHVFRDRQRILSFYGHLDPPSITLRAGQCVERGDLVGNIGDPRSPPHLHFEIRLHLPDTPGPGYWPSDPTRAGWRPPSATIWNERILANPGAIWTSPSGPGRSLLIGATTDDLLAVSNEGNLSAIRLEDGQSRWTQELPSTTAGVALDNGGELLYLVNSAGEVGAYLVSELASGDPESLAQPEWSIELGSGPNGLVLIPGGGIAFSSRRGTTAISDAGAVLWQQSTPTEIIDWAAAGDELLVLAQDGIWRLNDDEAIRWTDAISGHKIIASEQPYVYVEDGIYALDLDERSTELLIELPRGFPRSGDISELPGGGVLLAHLDTDDKRLIAVEPDGSLRWERSIGALGTRAVQLLEREEESYLLAQISMGATTGLDMFRIDTSNGELQRIFSGGSRSPASNLPRVLAVDGSFVISIPDVGLTLFDPDEEHQAPEE